jgi:hypothetical protein
MEKAENVTHLHSKRQQKPTRTASSPYSVAAMLGVPYPRFKRAIEAGEVATQSFGGKVFITKREIERLKALIADMYVNQ